MGYSIPCITLLTEIHLRGDGLEDEPFLPSVRQGELNLSLEKRLGKASEKVEEKPWKTRKGHPVGALIRCQTHLFVPAYIQFGGRSGK